MAIATGYLQLLARLAKIEVTSTSDFPNRSCIQVILQVLRLGESYQKHKCEEGGDEKGSELVCSEHFAGWIDLGLCCLARWEVNIGNTRCQRVSDRTICPGAPCVLGIRV